MEYFNGLVPIFDFDRFRKQKYIQYVNVRHSYIKRFWCWLLDEKLYPIDWEEVPPFDDYYNNDLNKHDPGTLIIKECVSQPDMITQNMLFFRKFLLIASFWGLYVFLENNQNKGFELHRLPFFGNTYFHSNGYKVFWLGFLYFIAEKSLVQRHNRIRYNN